MTRGGTRVALITFAFLCFVAACQDRALPGVDERVQELCELDCEKQDGCGLDLDNPTVEACVENCVVLDWAWDECREETITHRECNLSMTCEEFDLPPPESPCAAELSAYSKCFAAVHRK